MKTVADRHHHGRTGNVEEFDENNINVSGENINDPDLKEGAILGWENNTEVDDSDKGSKESLKSQRN